MLPAGPASHVGRVPWLLDKLRGRPVKFWGVRPPGWREWLREEPPFVAMAKQWAAAIRLAVTDGQVMDPRRVEIVAEYADMIQIGARNMQNFSLLKSAGRARKPVLLKRGMSATLEELLLSAE